MSGVALPLGYRSLQDFLLRWHSRNPDHPVVADSPLSYPTEATLKKNLRPAQRGTQANPSRKSFYEQRLPSDVFPSDVHTPRLGDYMRISKCSGISELLQWRSAPSS
jgi:hypothetical protein